MKNATSECYFCGYYYRDIENEIYPCCHYTDFGPAPCEEPDPEYTQDAWEDEFGGDAE